MARKSPGRTAAAARRIVAFVIAGIVMTALGSIAHSFFVQMAWSGAAGQAAGAGPTAVPFADRVSWAAHDFLGLNPTYGALASAALLIGILAAGRLARLTGHRTALFGLGGALAILALFTILRMSLGTVGIFGARGAMGHAAQMAAGLIAGMLFARLTSPRKARTNTP